LSYYNSKDIGDKQQKPKTNSYHYRNKLIRMNEDQSPQFVFHLKESFLNLRLYQNFGEDNDPMPISGLEEAWQDVKFEEVKRLVIDCWCHENVDCSDDDASKVVQNKDLWNRMCRLIQRRLTSVEIVRVEGLTDDAQFATLLQHLPGQQLKALHLERIQCDLPRTFDQIGSFGNLQSLKLSETFGSFGTTMHPQSKSSFEKLSNSLDKLKESRSLRELSIRDWNCSEDSWESVLLSIRSNFSLAKVSIDEYGCYGFTAEEVHDDQHHNSLESSMNGYQLNREKFTALQNGPRINQLCIKLQLPDDLKFNGDVEPWVEAMVSLQDQSDCFHFFLAQLPPDNYTFSTAIDESCGTASTAKRKIQSEALNNNANKCPETTGKNNNGKSSIEKAHNNPHSPMSSHPLLRTLTVHGCGHIPMVLCHLFSFDRIDNDNFQ